MPNEIDYQQLANALLAVKTKGVVSSTPTASYGHGNGGLFSYPGMSKPLFSAFILPRMGLQDRLPVRPNMDMNPLYGIMTGVTATSGSEPATPCDDPPTVGLAKLCTHTFVYGRQSRQTKVYDITRSGKLTNRGEFMDYQLYGGPGLNNPTAPTIPGASMGDAPNTEVAKLLFEMAVAWSRDFARELYTGNPASNNAGGGRTYYNGLDILINTGYRDAITSIACPAADSIVRSFGSQDISNGAGATLVRQVTNIYRNLKFIATRAGLAPVKWVITMPWAMFYEVSAVWPCAYETYRCSVTGDDARRVVDTQYLNKMVEDMRGDMQARTGQYLLIDGERVEVICDDGITETVLAGESFTAPMYFVPLTVLGGVPVTYMEHIDYQNGSAAGSAMRTANVLAADGFYSTSDNGRFLWHKKPPANFCVQMLAVTEPRLLLLTPHLAARLTSIKYTPIAHQRDFDPNSSYYVNGGQTDYGGYGPSFYSPTV